MRHASFVFFLLIAFCCTKEEISPRPFPQIKMLSVSDINSSSAKFHAEVKSFDEPIIDHGFLWLDEGSPRFSIADQISLGSLSNPATFEAVCERGMVKGKEYYVRSYATTANTIVYSNTLKFISQGSSPPVFKDFFPTVASWDDTITIVGENFSSVRSRSLVEFDGFNAMVVEASSNELRVKVPFQILNEFSDISVSAVGVSASRSSISKKFQLKPPVIEVLEPATAPAGSVLIIRGKNLNSSRIRVYFNDVSASITSLSVNSITCVIPDLPSGPVEVKVFTGNGNLFGSTIYQITE